MPAGCQNRCRKHRSRLARFSGEDEDVVSSLTMRLVVCYVNDTGSWASLPVFQSPRSTGSSSVVTISRPPTSLSLNITNRPFQHAAPHIWNKLPHSFREPHPHPGLSPSHYPTQVGSTLSSSPLSPSITPSLFHSRLKTHLFLKSFPPYTSP